MQRKVTTPEFFARNPVFSLDEATREFAPPGGRAGTVARLKHHLATGRLKLVGRGLYAVVPPGTAPDALRPDPFLVAAAARTDAVFSHHAALELLGENRVCYDVAHLWAATGWFLERTLKTFHASDAVLERYAERVPASPQYLDRNRRGGVLRRRWNLITPAELERLGGPDER